VAVAEKKPKQNKLVVFFQRQPTQTFKSHLRINDGSLIPSVPRANIPGAAAAVAGAVMEY